MSVVHKLYRIEIHRHYLLFGVPLFQTGGDNPFLELLLDPSDPGSRSGMEHIFSKLLGDSASTAGFLFAQQNTFYKNPEKTFLVNARMLLEACIFGGTSAFISEG